jgi:hypothetical protein
VAMFRLQSPNPDDARAVTRNAPRRSKLRDRFLLIGVALIICAAGVGSVVLGEIHHINPAWLLFAWYSVSLLPLIGKEFRGYFKRPSFVGFFTVWMGVHGATFVAMIAWVPLVLWPVVLVLELGIGFTVAHCLFGFPIHHEQRKG